MLLSYNELCKLQDTGVIQNSLREHVNGASIDVTLGKTVLLECPSKWNENSVVRLAQKETPLMLNKNISTTGVVLSPGEFILAQTEQVFNLPNDIAAEFKLKSSAARAGLQHALAGWCDPGWHGSVLTLELANTLRYRWIELQAGMKIGQVIFYRVEPVPDQHSYSAKGQYNGDVAVQASKGIR